MRRRRPSQQRDADRPRARTIERNLSTEVAPEDRRHAANHLRRVGQIRTGRCEHYDDNGEESASRRGGSQELPAILFPWRTAAECAAMSKRNYQRRFRFEFRHDAPSSTAAHLALNSSARCCATPICPSTRSRRCRNGRRQSPQAAFSRNAMNISSRNSAQQRLEVARTMRRDRRPDDPTSAQPDGARLRNRATHIAREVARVAGWPVESMDAEK